MKEINTKRLILRAFRETDYDDLFEYLSQLEDDEFNIISGYIIQKKLVAVHSVINKVTGLLLFILPLTFSIVPLKYSAVPLCAIATFAAVQEGHFIRTDRDKK